MYADVASAEDLPPEKSEDNGPRTQEDDTKARKKKAVQMETKKNFLPKFEAKK